MPAIVMKAYILVDTDKLQVAHQALFSTINRAVFESSNPIVDFAIGFEKAVLIPDHYPEGTFIKDVPEAQLLATANSLDRPC